jgi:hypothetical protein
MFETFLYWLTGAGIPKNAFIYTIQSMATGVVMLVSWPITVPAIIVGICRPSQEMGGIIGVIIGIAHAGLWLYSYGWNTLWDSAILLQGSILASIILVFATSWLARKVLGDRQVTSVADKSDR